MAVDGAFLGDGMCDLDPSRKGVVNLLFVFGQAHDVLFELTHLLPLLADRLLSVFDHVLVHLELLQVVLLRDLGELLLLLLFFLGDNVPSKAAVNHLLGFLEVHIGGSRDLRVITKLVLSGHS